MIKLTVAVALAVAVYVALGVLVPLTGTTAVILTVLGSWGAITYKGIASVLAFGAVSRGLS